MDAKKCLKLFEETKSYWSEVYRDFEEDVRFSLGDHYEGKSPEECRKLGLLSVPILPQFIHQVANDLRMNTPSIDVLPAGGEASVEDAKIRKGLIRHIEYRSKADAAYDTGSEYAVRGGFGFARVDHDYISEDSFLQELKILAVPNPQSIYLDSSYMECDGSDAEFGFVLETIKKQAFEEKYPGKEFVSFSSAPHEKEAEEITICEFFIKRYEVMEVQMAEDGSIAPLTEDGKEGKKTRKLKKVIVDRYKFSGADELEKTTFPGKYVPIVPFLGEVVWVAGKRYYLSLIRQAKDAQRRVNKWVSKESELLDLSPIAPIMAPYGAVEDFEEEYTKIGDVNVVRYKQFDGQGQRLDKPERLAPPQVPTGFVNATQESIEHAKQAMGLYNASLGQRSNETSGVAIDARKVEGEVATFHFGDNRNRSIQQIGRIIDCALGEVYDSARIVQIIGEEEEPKLIGVNGYDLQDGQKQHYDLKRGKYDVRVTTGASYTTKRQEAAALMSDLIAKKPELMGIFGDIMFKNMDVAGAEAIAARIKKTIPPQLLEDEDGEEPKQTDPEKMQMAQMIEQMQAAIQQMQGELQNKQAEEKLKSDELELKRGELELKAADLKVKMIQAAMPQAAAPQQGAPQSPQPQENAPSPDDSIEVLQAKLQDKLTREQQAQMQAQIDAENKLTEEQAEAERQAQETALKIEEMNQRAAQAEALNQMLYGISAQIGQQTAQLNQLTAQVAKPIELVRDANGVLVGAN